MFLEFANRGIWPDILAYKRLQNTHTLRPIAIIQHNSESVLFNRINHFQVLGFVVQKKDDSFVLLSMNQRELM